MEVNKILQGDCLEVMKTLEENSIDTIITDPPYGIGFMGKEWDTFKPSFVDEQMKKDNKRPSTRIARNQRSNIAGTYDQSLEGHLKFQDWCVEWMKECLRVAKPGATFLCCGSPRVYHHMALASERAGWILKDCIMWLYGSGFPKATDISKQLDKGHKRKVVGIDKTKQRPNAKKNRAKEGAVGEYGMMGDAGQITEPATEEAKLWNGWKSHGLKPAYEPILVAVKPNDGTYANNALKWGVSGLNIDGGRIKPQDEKDLKDIRSERKSERKGNNQVQVSGSRENRQEVTGRFPANIILDEEAGKMLDEQSGESKSTIGKRNPSGKKDTNAFGDYNSQPGVVSGHSDRGGASRFFYCAKASKSERNMGLEGFEEIEVRGDGGRVIDGYDLTDDSQIGLKEATRKYGAVKSKKANTHPTVKPLKLMEYLCTLTKTPTGGIVLDPFAGSGTTLIAAKKTGRDYIGIEREEEYIKIAEARLKNVIEQKILL